MLLLTVKRPLMQIFQWKSGLHWVVWSKTLIRYVPCLMNASALENNFQREPTWTVTFLNFCYAMFCLSSGDLWYKRLIFETNVYSPDLCSFRHWKGTFIAIDIVNRYEFQLYDLKFIKGEVKEWHPWLEDQIPREIKEGTTQKTEQLPTPTKCCLSRILKMQSALGSLYCRISKVSSN